MIRKFLLFAALFIVCGALQAQHTLHPYYVIIGGFAIENNAKRSIQMAKKRGYNAEYALNTNRNLFYVYVLKTDDRNEAITLVYKVRKDSFFKGAWVFNGSFNPPENSIATTTVEDKEVVTEPITESNQQGESLLPSTNSSLPTETEQPGTDPQAVDKNDPAPVVGKPFRFQLVNGVSNQPIAGMVKLMESDYDTAYYSFESDASVIVPAPKNTSKRWTMVCNMVGYKYVKKNFSYDAPQKSLAGTSIGANQEVIIPIKLVPVKKGDYIELERVRFFPNSSVIKPESKEELQSLVSLMTQNSRYKIRLHGHTKYSDARDVTTLGESTNFFSFDSGNKKYRASSKDFSKEMAETVKAYLVSEGIDSKRVETKGEGAVVAVYGGGGAADRVEIEVLRH